LDAPASTGGTKPTLVSESYYQLADSKYQIKTHKLWSKIQSHWANKNTKSPLAAFMQLTAPVSLLVYKDPRCQPIEWPTGSNQHLAAVLPHCQC